jgi:N6-L-threonylcarbamoyladenine synthase
MNLVDSSGGSASRGACILAIETSCDETAVAIFNEGRLVASEVASQMAIHSEFGGVVPEVASRNHLSALRPTLERAFSSAGLSLNDVDAVAATNGPGLATSLMLGMSMAKGLAVALKRPFIAVNHMEGHLLSPFMSDPEGPRDSIGLVVSGGHTLLVRVFDIGRYQLLGKTVDDAAGEAFDKVGKLLGLPYPGGPRVAALAEQGDARRFSLPRSMLHSGDYQFSFSGLKTAVRYLLPKHDPVPVADICASFQEAVVDVLLEKTMRAVRLSNVTALALSGGVSCNARLRERFKQACDAAGVRLLLAPPALCTDNAAMIAYVAFLRLCKGEAGDLAADVHPNFSAAAWLAEVPH